MLNPNKTTLWSNKRAGFYELTPMALSKGVAILDDQTIVFAPISRFFAPTSYDLAIDVDAWLATGKGVHLATEQEAAYCLAIQAEITCEFRPSGHEPFILNE